MLYWTEITSVVDEWVGVAPVTSLIARIVAPGRTYGFFLGVEMGFP
jgi:hypothetical protein